MNAQEPRRQPLPPPPPPPPPPRRPVTPTEETPPRKKKKEQQAIDHAAYRHPLYEFDALFASQYWDAKEWINQSPNHEDEFEWESFLCGDEFENDRENEEAMEAEVLASMSDSNRSMHWAEALREQNADIIAERARYEARSTIRRSEEEARAILSQARSDAEDILQRARDGHDAIVTMARQQQAAMREGVAYQSIVEREEAEQRMASYHEEGQLEADARAMLDMYRDYMENSYSLNQQVRHLHETNDEFETLFQAMEAVMMHEESRRRTIMWRGKGGKPWRYG